MKETKQVKYFMMTLRKQPRFQHLTIKKALEMGFLYECKGILKITGKGNKIKCSLPKRV